MVDSPHQLLRSKSNLGMTNRKWSNKDGVAKGKKEDIMNEADWSCQSCRVCPTAMHGTKTGATALAMRLRRLSVMNFIFPRSVSNTDLELRCVSVGIFLVGHFFRDLIVSQRFSPVLVFLSNSRLALDCRSDRFSSVCTPNQKWLMMKSHRHSPP